jgi:hypothetical protein
MKQERLLPTKVGLERPLALAFAWTWAPPAREGEEEEEEEEEGAEARKERTCHLPKRELLLLREVCACPNDSSTVDAATSLCIRPPPCVDDCSRAKPVRPASMCRLCLLASVLPDPLSPVRSSA